MMVDHTPAVAAAAAQEGLVRTELREAPELEALVLCGTMAPQSN
jgi:hypothetical protein